MEKLGVKEVKKLEVEEIKATLEGLADIMFDPFVRQEKDTRTAEQKWYLASDNQIVLPSENIWAFLFNEGNPAGCARTFEGKQGKEYIRMGQAHIVLEPAVIPFLRDGKPICFKGFDDKSCYVTNFSPRVKSQSLSIKQDVKPRPVLKLPWALSFTIKLVKNGKIDSTKLLNWFQRGGIEIALGTYRPRFGRFWVSEFK